MGYIISVDAANEQQHGIFCIFYMKNILNYVWEMSCYKPHPLPLITTQEIYNHILVQYKVAPNTLIMYWNTIRFVVVVLS